MPITIQPKTPPKPRSKISATKYLVGCVATIMLLAVAMWLLSDGSHPQPATPIAKKPISTSPTDQEMAKHVKFTTHQANEFGQVGLVVNPKTTEPEMELLLWYIRDRVRSHRYRDLGINAPTRSTNGGNSGYGDGMVSIFLGPKCVRELDDASPCGYGEHDVAFYQWGIESNPENDEGAIKGPPFPDKEVFSGSDKWLSSGERAAGSTPVSVDSDNQRVKYSYDFTLRNSGRLYAHAQGAQLRIQAAGFNSEKSRDEWLLDFWIDHSKELCELGFNKVRLVPSGRDPVVTAGPGKDYPVPCSK